MNERGLVLPKIHLQPLAIGALDDGFHGRVHSVNGWSWSCSLPPPVVDVPR
jgi:hypothetical protein